MECLSREAADSNQCFVAKINRNQRYIASRLLKMLRALTAVVLSAVAFSAGPEKPASGATFQDEVRTPATRDAPSVRRVTTADFQDSVWQAGRIGGADEDKKQMYREPFTLQSDAEIHEVINAAQARVLAMIAAEDKNHDGVLRALHVRE